MLGKNLESMIGVEIDRSSVIIICGQQNAFYEIFTGYGQELYKHYFSESGLRFVFGNHHL